MKTSILIRPAAITDTNDLLRIYAPYVTGTAITFEYEVPSTEDFCERIKHTLERYPYLVAEDQTGRIVGYAYASAFKTRAAYAWSVETSIYVAQDCRGQHIGSMLYDELERILKRQNIINVCACISASYEESIFFHKKCGYQLAATFHKSGFKFNTWHDMIWMEKSLGEHKVPPKDFIPYPEL